MAGRDISVGTLRVLRIALVVSVFLYARFGEAVHPVPRPVNPFLRAAIYVLAISIIPTTWLQRSREIKRARAGLARQQADIAAVRRRWRVIQLMNLAYFLAIPLYGLLLRFLGGTLLQALPFYITGVLLLSLLPLNDLERP
jgi:riboflavin transporter FmnP